MKIFRGSTLDGVSKSSGDAVPFYHEGKYHVFFLTPPYGTTTYPDRLRITWRHLCSDNLVDWEELPPALIPGDGCEADKDGCWTGSVIFAEGKFHAIYTGYQIDSQYPQTICHATSDDGIVWEKDPSNPIIIPKTDLFEQYDWRDPYVFYNEDDGAYWVILSARRNHGPITKRGCILLYKSSDMLHWEYFGPLYEPWHTMCPECPEMYKLGSRWYLCYSRFSESAGTMYRVADTPYGPWRTPSRDTIGNRRFYAAKSMANDEGRRFYFGWIHDKSENMDDGDWYWGGTYVIPHEVYAEADGELGVKMPQEIAASFDKGLSFSLRPTLGEIRKYGANSFAVNAVGTLNYGFFELDGAEHSFMLKCKIRIGDCRDQVGLILKAKEDLSRYYALTLDWGMQRASLTKLPMPLDPFWEETLPFKPAHQKQDPEGPRVCEKPFPFRNGDLIDVKVVIDGDIMEIFLGERAAFTYRSFSPADHQLGWMVQDGCADFLDIRFAK